MILSMRGCADCPYCPEGERCELGIVNSAEVNAFWEADKGAPDKCPLKNEALTLFIEPEEEVKE